MAKIIKQYRENTKWGEYTVKIYSNNIKVRSLVKPSDEYIKKKAKRNEKILKEEKEKQIIKDRENLIQEKMRSLAIAELEKEGKI